MFRTQLGSKVERACLGAAHYLESRRNACGLWNEFGTSAGRSQEWVSSFIIYSLASAGVARNAVGEAAAKIACTQRSDGGWGFNSLVPSDCDSTAWAMLALDASGIEYAYASAEAYVLRHKSFEDSGFSTYDIQDYIEDIIGFPANDWRRSHVCVTATAMRALQLSGLNGDMQRSAEFLLHSRRSNNLWKAYWWPSQSFVTFQCLTAIRDTAECLSVWQECGQSLLNRQRSDGSWSSPGVGHKSCVFETAFALLCLGFLHCIECSAIFKAAAERGVKWLLQMQNEDGSWPSSPILSIPHPLKSNATLCAPFWVSDACGTDVILSDVTRCFTTASALLAMSQR